MKIVLIRAGHTKAAKKGRMLSVDKLWVIRILCAVRSKHHDQQCARQTQTDDPSDGRRTPRRGWLDEAKKIKVADGMDPGVTMGPVINKHHYEKVVGQRSCRSPRGNISTALAAHHFRVPGEHHRQRFDRRAAFRSDHQKPLPVRRRAVLCDGSGGRRAY